MRITDAPLSATNRTHPLISRPAVNRATPASSTDVPQSRRRRPPGDDIQFLRWPLQYCERDRFLSNRTPVLWVAESNAEAPECIDPLEDWVRPPLKQGDVDARVESLIQRARNEQIPAISPDNVLCTHAARLPLADTEAAIMHVLVDNFQRVASRDQLIERAWGEECDDHRNALDLRILRLRRRIKPLKLSIVTVWGRGYLLEPA
ncbi:winged helix-turn-helix domain-containing protein [Solicola gregarius]|uniref:Winged helix-turn-helix domain-containing protein n=1 Tax=Solicola gregarius TaxID=2908642 RepID=A0AA46YJM3_9ACTN|nr:winged helix-turn-helix domain-containing protein [Solicola gregarius]UYM03656.1 winged helix-turn-helix domain-containing protein [Solicola gregarius]